MYDYDYTLIRLLLELRGVQTTGYGETKCDVTSCYKIQTIRDSSDDPENKYLLSPEDYARFRPDVPEISDLRKITVYTIYCILTSFYYIQKQ